MSSKYWMDLKILNLQLGGCPLELAVIQLGVEPASVQQVSIIAQLHKVTNAH
ncbi:MAG: hypothetical protein ACYC11_05140 [Bellilinea sp.]